MKNLKPFFIFILSLALFSSECEKDDDSDSQVQHEVTFKVNGKPFVPKQVGSTAPPTGISYDTATNQNYQRLRISATRLIDTLKNLHITIIPMDVNVINDELEFDLSTSSKTHINYSTSNYSSPDTEYDSILAGKLIFTHFDTLNSGQTKGTFWFDAVSQNNDTIHITEGIINFNR